MNFKFESTNCLVLPNSELSELQSDVYVGEGYTEAELAEALFDTRAIRSRRRMVTASNNENQRLARLAIMVHQSLTQETGKRK